MKTASGELFSMHVGTFKSPAKETEFQSNAKSFSSHIDRAMYSNWMQSIFQWLHSQAYQYDIVGFKDIVGTRIVCHRKKDAIAGYCWGIERKARMARAGDGKIPIVLNLYRIDFLSADIQRVQA